MIHTGGAFLECPVGGTIKPALDGALVGMAAGDRATFDRIRLLLDEVSSGSMWFWMPNHHRGLGHGGEG